jgi:PAS domain S-box-containing protein
MDNPPESPATDPLDGTQVEESERALRQSQHLLALVLETLPVGVMVMNASADVLLTNQASQRIWGNVIPSGSERYGKSVGFWHSGTRLETADWGSQRALHGGETSVGELIDIEALDGQKRVIANSAAPIRDEQAQIIGCVVVNEDVTERVRQQEELGRHERQQRALAQLTLSALKNGDLMALFEEATSLARDALGVKYAVVLEWAADEERMVFRAGAGPWAKEIVARAVVPTTPGFMAWFYLHSALPLVVEDLVRETRFSQCELLAGHGVKCGVAVHIAGKQRPFGVLQACSDVMRRFTDDEVHFVWAVANVLATSVERVRAVSELSVKREELRTLSHKLIEAQEAERRAVARELHDDFGQVLTALRLNLQRQPPNDQENIAMVDGAIARMRELAQDLRPPQLDELGLASSLRWYFEREAARAGLCVELSLEALPTTPAIAVATTCFRVAQEALTNVIRHAQARSVWVDLRVVDGQLELMVRDDGVGFDVSRARSRAAQGASLGLLGMQERMELVRGELEIDSAPGRGTRIRARMPLAGG